MNNIYLFKYFQIVEEDSCGDSLYSTWEQRFHRVEAGTSKETVFQGVFLLFLLFFFSVLQARKDAS